MPTRSGTEFSLSQEVPALSKENEHNWLSYVELVDFNIILESLMDTAARKGQDDSLELKFFCEKQNEIQAILKCLSSSTVVPKDECDDVLKRTIGCVLSDLKRSLPFSKERKLLLHLECIVAFFIALFLRCFKKEQTDDYPPVDHPIREFSRQLKEKQLRLSYAAMHNDPNAAQMDDRDVDENFEPMVMQFHHDMGCIFERKGKENAWTERAEFLDCLASNILSNIEKEIQKPSIDFYLLEFYLDRFKRAKAMGQYVKVIPSEMLYLVYPDETFKTTMSKLFPMIWDHEHAPAA